jgi:hypothetical protein
LGAYKTVDIQKFTPPATYPSVEGAEEDISVVDLGVVGGVAGLAGLAIGAAGMAVARRSQSGEEEGG